MLICIYIHTQSSYVCIYGCVCMCVCLRVCVCILTNRTSMYTQRELAMLQEEGNRMVDERVCAHMYLYICSHM